jgi:hypothetical protein
MQLFVPKEKIARIKNRKVKFLIGMKDDQRMIKIHKLLNNYKL